MWCRGNESDEDPLGCGFDPWPRSVGQGTSVAVSCGVGCRCGLDPALPWLWCRPAAVAPIQSLAWEPPCAVGEAPKSKKKKKYIRVCVCVCVYTPIYMYI